MRATGFLYRFFVLPYEWTITVRDSKSNISPTRNSMELIEYIEYEGIKGVVEG